jgi:hypothetical protein
LKDRTEDDGSITLAKDQAKELCIRLAFGGSLRAWKFENQVARGQDLPIVAKLESSLELIRDEIWNANPQMIQNLEENDEDFSAKSSEDKKKSLMAIWSQTKERLIQEECVAYLVKNFPSVQLRDVISSQDGMMVLKEQMEGVDIPLLFQRFNEIIKRKFNIQMTWVVKEFDEALSVPRCSTMPIDITLEDLEKGEAEIAGLIAPAFKSTFKYFNEYIAKDKSIQDSILKIAQKNIEIKKQYLLSDFKSHPISSEISSGPGASNISRTLGGYGNLFSFIGFSAGDNPIDDWYNFVSKTVNLNSDISAKVSGDGVVFTLELNSITEENLRNHPLPWESGRSWIMAIERGISGFSFYISKSNEGRSSGGIQSQYKKKSGGGSYKPTKYWSQMWNNFIKNIEK